MNIFQDFTDRISGVVRSVAGGDAAGLDLGRVLVEPPRDPIRVQARIRHSHRPAPALVKARGDGTAEVVFDEPQRAITPGQSVVWYRDDLVVGGGVISR